MRYNSRGLRTLGKLKSINFDISGSGEMTARGATLGAKFRSIKVDGGISHFRGRSSTRAGASILHLAVSADEISRHSSSGITDNASPAATPRAAKSPARRKLLDNIFARIAVISISFGAAGGFYTDYPIIQIPLSSSRMCLIKPLILVATRAAERGLIIRAPIP